MVEMLRKLTERIIREHDFTSENTYEHSLAEFYSDHFKQLAMLPTIGYRETDVNLLFTRSSMQFGNPFSGYSSPSFSWYLGEYYGAFTGFHYNEGSQER